MTILKYVFIATVCFTLVTPTGGWLKKALSNIGKSIEKGFNSVIKTVKNEGCKAIFDVGCTWLVDTVGDAIASSTTANGFVIGMGKAMGLKECRVRNDKCQKGKRSVTSQRMEVILPFSDEFGDYDANGDKFITYEEFVFTVLRSVNLTNPSELGKPFVFADQDGDRRLDTQEFMGAPLLFAHPLKQRQRYY